MADNNKGNLSIPSNTPISDKDGRLTNSWLIWFNNLYNRVGKSTALTNEELANAVVDNTTDITALQAQTDSNTTAIAGQTISITNLNSNVSTLNTQTTANTAAIAGQTISITNLTTQTTTNTNDITTLKANTVQTISNLGTGQGLYSTTVTNNARFKGLVAGTNITLDVATDPNSIIVNAGSGAASIQVGFCDITVVNPLVGPTPGNTLVTLTAGKTWATGSFVNNTSQITVAAYSSSSQFAYLTANKIYFVYIEFGGLNRIRMIDASTFTGASSLANAKLLYILETDATKIFKITDYRPMNIYINNTTFMFATQLVTGLRTYAFNATNFSSGGQPQVANSGSMTTVAGVYPRFVRPALSLLCLTAEKGYVAGDETTGITGPAAGPLGPYPFRMLTNDVYAYQGVTVNIFNVSTGNWEVPTYANWAIVLKITLEYH